MLTKPINYTQNHAGQNHARRGRRVVAATMSAAALSVAALAGCAAPSSPSGAAVTLRLGYFANITQAPALVGLKSGLFADALGTDTTLETVVFNAGPEAVEALFAGAIDAAFIGPNPAINAYTRSGGRALRIVSGSTSGGAFLVVSRDVSSVGDLEGRTVASPQLGSTQDVAVRWWLATQGYATDGSGGGAIAVVPQPNADALTAFKQGQIAGAWVPEPWATRLILEGGGHVLVDERDLWPAGTYPSTELVVSAQFLDDHPDQVDALLQGLVASIDLIAADPGASHVLANEAIADVVGKPLTDAVLAAGFKNLSFDVDPHAASLAQSAKHAQAVDLLDSADISEILDLSILNRVLRRLGRPEVSAS